MWAIHARSMRRFEPLRNTIAAVSIAAGAVRDPRGGPNKKKRQLTPLFSCAQLHNSDCGWRCRSWSPPRPAVSAADVCWKGGKKKEKNGTPYANNARSAVYGRFSLDFVVFSFFFSSHESVSPFFSFWLNFSRCRPVLLLCCGFAAGKPLKVGQIASRKKMVIAENVSAEWSPSQLRQNKRNPRKAAPG